MEESKYIFIYPTVEIRINLTELFDGVYTYIVNGIKYGELDKTYFTKSRIHVIINTFCYDIIYRYIEDKINKDIDEVELFDLQNELVDRLIPHLDELLKLCNKK